MGSLNARGMAEGVAAGALGLRQAIAWHLTSNHYPPVPEAMVDPCLDAIEAYDDGDVERLIELPDPITYKNRSVAPAWAIVEQHHLDDFVGAEPNDEEV